MVSICGTIYFYSKRGYIMKTHSITAIKKTNHKFLNISDSFATLFGYNNPNNLVGLDDYQLTEYACKNPFCGTTKIADEFIAEDEIAYRGGRIFILEAMRIHDKLHCFLIYKSPYHEHNKIKGVYIDMIDLGNVSQLSLSHYIKRPNIHISEHTKILIDAYKAQQKNIFSQRELQCIQLLLQGLIIKDIAAALNLSPRTVESYLNNIKSKLGVNRNTQIISKVMAENLI